MGMTNIEKRIKGILFRFIYDNSFPMPTLDMHKQISKRKAEDLYLKLKPFLKEDRETTTSRTCPKCGKQIKDIYNLCRECYFKEYGLVDFNENEQEELK